jgi:tetratricopeptide (TPR) repeat protein
MKNYDKATQYYLLASKSDKFCYIAFFNIGCMHVEIGDFYNGICFIEKARDSNDLLEHITKKGLHNFFNKKEIKYAVAEYCQNKKKNCLLKLKEIYNSEENNIIVNFLIANSYFQTGKFEKSRCFYEKILL